MKTKPLIIITLIAIGLFALFDALAANQPTYTVKTPGWQTTNAIEVIPDHEKAVPPCTLIRYVQDGRTNEFHAWAVPVIVTTNQTAVAPRSKPGNDAHFELKELSTVHQALYGAMLSGYMIGLAGGSGDDMRAVFMQIKDGDTNAVIHWLQEHRRR